MDQSPPIPTPRPLPQAPVPRVRPQQGPVVPNAEPQSFGGNLTKEDLLAMILSSQMVPSAPRDQMNPEALPNAGYQLPTGEVFGVPTDQRRETMARLLMSLMGNSRQPEISLPAEQLSPTRAYRDM